MRKLNARDQFKNKNTRKLVGVKIMRVTVSKSKRNFPAFILIENTKVTNKEEIANHFNNFFVSIGPKLASAIDLSNKLPKLYEA